MKFIEAMHIISSVINFCFERTEDEEDVSLCKQAEVTMYKLVDKLKEKGVVNLEDLD